MFLFINKLNIIVLLTFWKEKSYGLHTNMIISIKPKEKIKIEDASVDEYIILDENYNYIGKFRCYNKWHTGKFEYNEEGVWSIIKN